MEDTSNRYNAAGRRSGKPPAPKEIKHTLKDSDRGVKFEDYQAHGVGEYWIVDPAAETVEINVALVGQFPKKARRQKAGQIRSTVVKGFEIPVRALFDDVANMAALKQLMA